MPPEVVAAVPVQPRVQSMEMPSLTVLAQDLEADLDQMEREEPLVAVVVLVALKVIP